MSQNLKWTSKAYCREKLPLGSLGSESSLLRRAVQVVRRRTCVKASPNVQHINTFTRTPRKGKVNYTDRQDITEVSHNYCRFSYTSPFAVIKLRKLKLSLRSRGSICKVILSLFRHSSFRKSFVRILASVRIMAMEKYEVRVLLRHYWKQNYKATAAAKQM
jgi:hypothetical protein